VTKRNVLERHTDHCSRHHRQQGSATI